MASSQSSLRIPAAISHVHDAAMFVSAAARRMGMSDDTSYRCELAVEEVVTNIIEHGYVEQAIGQVVDIVIQLVEHDVIITIADDAPQYDPLDREDPDPATKLEDRKHGGWGIFFVKQYVDHVAYQYIENRNQIILTKKIN